jgi:putative transposase
MNGLPQPRQPDLWDVTPSPCADGKEKGKSKPIEPQAIKGDSAKRTWNDSQVLQLNLFDCLQSVTDESVPAVKEMTWNDKSIILAKDTQKQKLWQKLGQDSILNGGNLSPYSNELCREIFKGLSLPIQTGFVGSDSTLWNGSVKNLAANSWFSMTVSSRCGRQSSASPDFESRGTDDQNKNSLQICCPSSIVSVQGYTDSENIKNKSARSYGRNNYKKSQNPTPNKSVKIPVFPCKELHQIWKQWLAAYRWVYNQCVSFLNAEKILPEKMSLDQYIQGLQKQAENNWTNCLGKTRQEAVCEAEQAYKQARKANQGKAVQIKYRSCRDNSQVIQFKNDAFTGEGFPQR